MFKTAVHAKLKAIYKIKEKVLNPEKDTSAHVMVT